MIDTGLASSVDQLLEWIVEPIQLTRAQYQEAVAVYDEMRLWLHDPSSGLAKHTILIYPQGSGALGTTIRPKGRVEYDLDAVCLIEAAGVSPIALYQSVLVRIKHHPKYGSLVRERDRCIRLKLKDKFHFDLIPAIPDPERGGTFILVPDRKLKFWVGSNPLGYIEAFKTAETLVLEEVAKRDWIPVPPQEPAREKSVLALLVQLAKRRRDVFFDGADVAPSSILLTTMAMQSYRGVQSLGSALLEFAEAMKRRVMAAEGQPLVVLNPSNPGENLAACLESKPCRDALEELVSTFAGEARELSEAAGYDEIYRLLRTMFAESAEFAMKRAADEVNRKRASDGLRVTPAMASVTAARPRPSQRIPRNTFYGGAWVH